MTGMMGLLKYLVLNSSIKHFGGYNLPLSSLDICLDGLSSELVVFKQVRVV